MAGTVIHNFLGRLPGRLNAASMGRHGIDMSTGAIHNVLSGTGLSLGGPPWRCGTAYGGRACCM